MIEEQMETKELERGTLAAFQIDKDTKKVETLADFHLYDNGQRVYTPANKPSATDIGAVPKSDVVAGSSYAQLAGKIPRIGSDGVLEVARYIDFHTKDSTADFDVRIDCYDANNLNITGGKLKVEGNEVFHADHKPFKVHHVGKPSGLVDGRYYPILITGTTNNQELYINTRQSGGSDPMNNCSFHGIVRSMGWSDGISYTEGMFTAYTSSERAIHSIVGPTENDGAYVIYVEARSFPIVLRVDSSCSVAVHSADVSYGTTTFKAGITSAQITSGDFGTKAHNLQDFAFGTGYYRYDRKVNDRSQSLTGVIDFDNYNVGGTYNIYNPAAGSNNPPPFSYGTLLVIGRGGSEVQHGFVTQYATDKSTRKTYIRTRNDTNWAWTSWVQIYDSVNKPTPADLGAVNKSGDTMTGTLTTADIKVAAGKKIIMPTTDWATGATIEALPAGDGYGSNLNISSGGNTVLGAGESANNLRDLTNGENLYLTADGNIDLISGANTWADRKVLRIDGAGGVFINNGQTTARCHFGSSSTYVARSGVNLYVAANDTNGKVYIEGKANPIARVNGADHEIYHKGNKPTTGEIQAAKAIGEWTTGASANITTGEFITLLTDKGAFNDRYWVARGSWSYANNKTITDTGCGNIHLSGCVIEVISASVSVYTIRITTPTTTSGGGVTMGEFIYVNNGSSYSPGWRRQYNTAYKPTASDVGALSTSGGTASGVIAISEASTSSRQFEAKQGTVTGVFRLSDAAAILGTQDGGSWTGAIKVGKSDFVYTPNASTWHKVYHQGFKPTAADVGAFPITGGNLNGDLNLSTTSTDARDIVWLVNGVEKGRLWLNDNGGNENSLAWRKDASGLARKIYHEGFKPTASDVGALPITGGRLTGVLYAKTGILSESPDGKNWVGLEAADGSAAPYISSKINGTAKKEIEFTNDGVKIAKSVIVTEGSYQYRRAAAGGYYINNTKDTSKSKWSFGIQTDNTGLIGKWKEDGTWDRSILEFHPTDASIIANGSLSVKNTVMNIGYADNTNLHLCFRRANGAERSLLWSDEDYLRMRHKEGSWLGIKQNGSIHTSANPPSMNEGVYNGTTAGGTWRRGQGVYHAKVSHQGSSWAPMFSSYFHDTEGYDGFYTLGHLSSPGAGVGHYCLHFIDGSGNAGKFWSFNGSNGDFVSPGNVVAYSDSRVKTNVETITGALDKIGEIRGVTYDRTDITTDRQMGVIAQEVQKVCPEVVHTVNRGAAGDILGVSYGNLVGLLIEGIKELRSELDELRTQMNK